MQSLESPKKSEMLTSLTSLQLHSSKQLALAGLFLTIYQSPTDEVEGDYRFALRLSVRPSVRPSVRCPADQFSALFFVVLADIDLIFGIQFNHDKLQIKFEFRSGRMIFGGVMVLGLRKFTQIISFPHFCSSCLQTLI